MKRTAALLFLAASAASQAAVVSYSGSVEDSTVNDWRTTSTAKPMDPDGDNFYGTHGAVHWTVAGVNEFPAGSPSPGWAYQGDTGVGQFNSAAYAQIDSAANPLVNAGAGIAAVVGTFTFEMTGIAGTYAGKTLRIGVMADVLSPGEWAADTNKSFRLVQTVGGTGDSGVITLRGGAAGNGQPELYFFDVSGVNPGDRFQIVTGSTAPSGQPGYIGPVTWDLYTAVPEPSSALLGGLALLGFARRRRA
jgi:hypothetical protein